MKGFGSLLKKCTRKGVPRRVDMPTLSWNLQLHNDGSQRSDGVRSYPLDMLYSKVYAFVFFLEIFPRFFFADFFCKQFQIFLLKIQISEKS